MSIAIEQIVKEKDILNVKSHAIGQEPVMRMMCFCLKICARIYQKLGFRPGEVRMEERTYKMGQLIYGVEFDIANIEHAEVSGYLFMSECGDYILCSSEYVDCSGNFKRQLKEMYLESVNNYGVEIHMLHKKWTFPTIEEADLELKKLLLDN